MSQIPQSLHSREMWNLCSSEMQNFRSNEMRFQGHLRWCQRASVLSRQKTSQELLVRQTQMCVRAFTLNNACTAWECTIGRDAESPELAVKSEAEYSLSTVRRKRVFLANVCGIRAVWFRYSLFVSAKSSFHEVCITLAKLKNSTLEPVFRVFVFLSCLYAFRFIFIFNFCYTWVNNPFFFLCYE